MKDYQAVFFILLLFFLLEPKADAFTIAVAIGIYFAFQLIGNFIDTWLKSKKKEKERLKNG